MCSVQLAAMAVSVAGQAQQQQAAAKVAQGNAAIAAQQAVQDENLGELNAQRVQRETSQTIGAQRAGYSARGLDISEGTPANVIDQTSFFGGVDAQTARDNGRRNAEADLRQGAGFRAQARNDRVGAGLSLISGAGQVAAKWYTSNPSGAGLNTGNSYYGADGGRYANFDLSGTNLGSGD